MEFKDFKEAVVAGLEEIVTDGEVHVNEVLKNNNVKLTGVSIRREGSNVCPTIYLDDFFQREVSVKETVERILELSEDNKTDMDFSWFSDWEQVKEKVRYRLINRDANEELLSDVPCVGFLDLAIVFYVGVEDKAFGLGSILIKNEHMKSWEGINVNDLYAAAKVNMALKEKFEYKNICEVLKQMMNIDEEENILAPEKYDSCYDMFVITNKKKLYGASALSELQVLEKIANELDSDLIIIPSSIHELIVIKNEGELVIENIRNMVQEVNMTQVSIDEVLSDNVYIFERESGMVRIA